MQVVTYALIADLCRTRVIPHVMTERSKPVTELPAPSAGAIYDVQVFEPHKGMLNIL